MKPSVGRIVHFYDESLADKNTHPHQRLADGTLIRLNSQGAGPYPAMVVQSFDGDYVNLLVHGWGGDWREGSVSEHSELNRARYWVWPPKVEG